MSSVGRIVVGTDASECELPWAVATISFMIMIMTASFMMSYFSLLPLYHERVICPGCGMSSVARIVGGTEASECEFPWAVVINVGTTFCGGSIIDSNTVLTAGHCVYTT